MKNERMLFIMQKFEINTYVVKTLIKPKLLLIEYHLL